MTVEFEITIAAQIVLPKPEVRPLPIAEPVAYDENRTVRQESEISMSPTIDDPELDEEIEDPLPIPVPMA
jgi:hypothetical protein